MSTWFGMVGVSCQWDANIRIKIFSGEMYRVIIGGHFLILILILSSSIASGSGTPTPCTDDSDCDSSNNEKCVDNPSPSPSSGAMICETEVVPSIQTPMVYYRGNVFNYGARCKSTPGSINDVQISDLAVTSKQEMLGQGQNDVPVCNWKTSGLECVADDNDVTTVDPATNPPGNNNGGSPLGTCKCLLALGEKAFWVPKFGVTKKKMTPYGKCVIPINKDHHSKCGHELVIPSGEIYTGGKVTKLVGNSKDFCAPGSVCRTGYNYVGLRCSCKPQYKLNVKKGICEGAGAHIKVAIILLLFPIFNAFVLS